MDNKQILNILLTVISKEKIKLNEPMKNHTSFKVGGTADFFVTVDSIKELQEVLKISKENDIPLFIIGNGSNILVLDGGIRGIVVKLNLKNIEIKEIENKKIEIDVESGTPIGLLAQKMLKEGIQGLEELSGIPGTIGGAVIMNAGAHGKEIKDILKEITAMDYSGHIHKFTNEEANFSYRYSKFVDEDYIILSAKLELQYGNKEQIKEKMQTFANYRKEKQPIETPSAGSTFKRGTDFVTAMLIDQAGLKGYKIGGAEVSEKHAGFVVNTGTATAKDILDLVKYIEETVYEKFNKKIELEIKIIGDAK